MVFARLSFFWCTWLQGSIVFQCCTACVTSWPKLGLYISSLSVPFSLLIQINGLGKKNVILISLLYNSLNGIKLRKIRFHLHLSLPWLAVTQFFLQYRSIAIFARITHNFLRDYFLVAQPLKMHWKSKETLVQFP